MKNLFLTILIIFTFYSAYSTHNRAGEITYKQITSYTYEITVTTFTNTKPTSDGTEPVRRLELDVYWGDNTYSKVNRTTSIDLPDYYLKNTYVATHTYPGPGTFSIIVEDPNRNEGVENIPNSVNVVFSIKTILQINSLLGVNNTPILLNPPIDKAGTFRKFVHNPAAYDPDGDSISYRLTTCTGENGEPIPNYTLPKSSNKPIYMDAITGDLVWDSPIDAGIFNIAFFIEEWRNGIKIGQITRDMQIEVFDTENTPPTIEPIESICAIAGDTININVTAHDSADQIILLDATGGAFEIDDSVSFNTDTSGNYGITQGSFNWITKCNQVRKESYQIVFKASDLNNEINLVDQQTVYITINGPAPENLTAYATNNSIELNWETYTCSNAKAFNIYRSTTYFHYTSGYCEVGVPAFTGYELIHTIKDINATQFIDNNNGDGLNQGFEYCYMITAVFEDGIEGKASDEACIELQKGIPIITNVSVTEHDETNGEIYIAWVKPTEFDSISYPGPYTYYIKRSNGIWGNEFEVIDSLTTLDRTNYTDVNVNTMDQAYSYRIEIHNNNGLTEQPMTASSIYPETSGYDNRVLIAITKNTPWINTDYSIFRKNNQTNAFDSIGTTNSEVYIDNNLENNTEYWYQVKSYGHYDLDEVPRPIINYSHLNSGIPIDTIAPKKLNLTVNTDCNTFINKLNWQTDIYETDIIKYYIYYKPKISGDLTIIDSVLHPDTLQYLHTLTDYPSGCYAVTAVDSNFNQSVLSNIACNDICSFYELPNVFTPNNDTDNDIYVPITPTDVINRFVEKVDFKVFSRWGNLVYKTANPELNWNGNNYKTKAKVNPGVYYYVCTVYEKRISGIEERNIVGFIHVFYEK